MRSVPVPLAPVAFLLAWAAPTSAQLIIGRARDATDNTPIPYVDVALLADGDTALLTVQGDAGGRFEITVPRPGSYRLRGAALGYDTVTTEPLELAADDELHVELRLGARAIALDPLRVVDRRRLAYSPLQDYFRRLDRYRAGGSGVVLSRRDLAEMPGLDLGDILARQPYVRRRTVQGTSYLVFRSPIGECVPSVYLDGAPASTNDILRIDASDLEGVEVYRLGNQVPPRYNRGDRCGAVLAWTRRDARPMHNKIAIVVSVTVAVTALLLVLAF
jgi:hypothetical protein